MVYVCACVVYVCACVVYVCVCGVEGGGGYICVTSLNFAFTISGAPYMYSLKFMLLW